MKYFLEGKMVFDGHSTGFGESLDSTKLCILVWHGVALGGGACHFAANFFLMNDTVVKMFLAVRK